MSWRIDTGQPGGAFQGNRIDDLDVASGTRTLCPPITDDGDSVDPPAIQVVGRWTFPRIIDLSDDVLLRCGADSASS